MPQIGAIIGMRGKTITQLRASSQATLKVAPAAEILPGALPEGGEPADEMLVIEGPYASVLASLQAAAGLLVGAQVWTIPAMTDCTLQSMFHSCVTIAISWVRDGGSLSLVKFDWLAWGVQGAKACSLDAQGGFLKSSIYFPCPPLGA